MTDTFAAQIRLRRQAILEPSANESVVDTCLDAVRFFEDVILDSTASATDTALAMEGIATAMAVADVYESPRSASDFALGALAVCPQMRGC